MIKHNSNEDSTLLNPDNCTLIFIDHQPQMAFGVASIDRQLLLNNVVGLAKAGRLFKAPTILTTIASKSFSGEIWPQLQDVFPDIQPIERTSMNSWEDAAFVSRVEQFDRKKLVMCALWTEVCLAFPALSALRAGYDVHIVVDASGGTSAAAHDAAVSRMVHSGAIPVTWMQVLLEWQRDWARTETYDGVMEIVREHGGAYGQGVEYASTMLHGAQPSRRVQSVRELETVGGKL